MKKFVLSAISLISLFPAQAYGEDVQSLRARHGSTVTGSHGATAAATTSRRPIADASTAYVAQPYGYPYNSPGYQTPVQGYGYPYNNVGYNSGYGAGYTSGYPSNFNNYGVYANPSMGYGYGMNAGYGGYGMNTGYGMPMGAGGYNNGSSIWNSPLILNHRFSSPGNQWGGGYGSGYNDYNLMGGYGGYGAYDYSLMGGYGGYDAYDYSLMGGYGYGSGYGSFGSGYDSCYDASCGGGGFAMGMGGAGWDFGLSIGW